MSRRLLAPSHLPAPVLVALSIGCHPSGTQDVRPELRAALATYDTLIQRMDAEAIGASFVAEGQSIDGDQPPLTGPVAIRDHLLTFAAFKVLENHLEADSTSVHGDTGWQTGTYRQRVRVPAGDTVTASGRFEITWNRIAPANWKIRRLHTFRP